jgi:AcrR family transcriptional regulator
MPGEEPSRPATQARGRARRTVLLDAARALLAERTLDAISLVMVAERAGIPVSSAYHFFPEVGELWKDLTRAIAVDMAAETTVFPPATGWEELIGLFLARSRDVFNNDPAACQLMLGPHTPPQIKHAGCKEDLRFGAALWRAVSAQFALTALANEELFFKAILIADLFFALSVADSGRITPEVLGEARLAMCAYLRLYLPVRLARVAQ